MRVQSHADFQLHAGQLHAAQLEKTHVSEAVLDLHNHYL